MSENNYEWFVRPLDADSNKAIANFLLSHNALEENIMLSMPSYDDQPIDVFRLRSYADVALIIKSSASLGLKFKIYNRTSPKGILRECDFGQMKKEAKAKAAAALLAKKDQAASKK